MFHINKNKCFIKNGKYKFKCKCLGYKSNFFGEVIFNTAMLGYEEIITDPSYYNQIIVFSNLNIGNTGINIEDIESHRIWISGIIIKNLSNFYSNFRTKINLYKFLKKNKILIIEIKNTRTLIKNIRENKNKYINIYFKKNKKLKIKKKKYLNKVSTKINFSLNKYSYFIKKNKINKFKTKILVIDLGLKTNILRNLSDVNQYLIITSYKIKINNIKKIKPNGIIITNGPGNPKEYNKKLYRIIKEIIESKIPILGICLGHQILSNFFGYKLKKLFIGHHGSNHPIKIKNKLIIASQNHNYITKLSNNKKIKNINSLFDKTNQGFIFNKRKIISTQGHPEGAPGTNDFKFIFRKFIKIIIKNEKNK
ncbi:MAG: glutamine-hydrolyzing carbamoyl-phosphate synthase small subunit [Candidatus Vidania fulgoroideorum]